ncbi:MAG: maleylpyruvate isomerase family mycothiol-dependent enzyme [Acidimicrobiia bacterium]
MRDWLDHLHAQHDELWSLLEPLDAAGWTRPTPCPGWDVGDVVLHLTQTDQLGIASLRGDLSRDIEQFMRAGGASSVDDAAAASVEHARGTGGPQVGEAWRVGAAELRAGLAAADPRERVQWVVGRLSVRTLAATRLAECWIHTGDVAVALGIALAPTDRLRPIARLAWRTVPYAFERSGRALHGPVAFALTGPDGDAWEFGLDEEPVTVVRGPAADLCAVAARRKDPSQTALVATGPDAAAVLELVRTYA